MSGKRLREQEAYALILADAFTANHVLVRYCDGNPRRERAKDMSHVGKGFRFWSDNDRAHYDDLTRLLRYGGGHIEECEAS